MICYPLSFTCTLTKKTLTFIGQNFSSGESDEFFVWWRNFRPTNSFARRKFRPTKFRLMGKCDGPYFFFYYHVDYRDRKCNESQCPHQIGCFSFHRVPASRKTCFWPRTPLAWICKNKQKRFDYKTTTFVTSPKCIITRRWQLCIQSQSPQYI